MTVAPPSKRRLQPIRAVGGLARRPGRGLPRALLPIAISRDRSRGRRSRESTPTCPRSSPSCRATWARAASPRASAARADEGTTYEASCYTDPLALEHLTGSLSTAIAYVGEWDAAAQLRFTTKFAAVDPLLALDHGGKVRMRASINPAAYARFEGGTAPVADRLVALRRMADAGYLVGLTIAPIIAAPGWEEAYGGLIDQVAAAFAGSTPDLTVELITHRYTPGSKAVLESWYPGSSLDMGGGGPRREADQVRHRQARLRSRHDADVARLLRRADRDDPALRARALLDLEEAVDHALRQPRRPHRLGIKAAPARLHLGENLLAPPDHRLVEGTRALHLFQDHGGDHLVL